MAIPSASPIMKRPRRGATKSFAQNRRRIRKSTDDTDSIGRTQRQQRCAVQWNKNKEKESTTHTHISRRTIRTKAHLQRTVQPPWGWSLLEHVVYFLYVTLRVCISLTLVSFFAFATLQHLLTVEQPCMCVCVCVFALETEEFSNLPSQPPHLTHGRRWAGKRENPGVDIFHPQCGSLMGVEGMHGEELKINRNAAPAWTEFFCFVRAVRPTGTSRRISVYHAAAYSAGHNFSSAESIVFNTEYYFLRVCLRCSKRQLFRMLFRSFYFPLEPQNHNPVISAKPCKAECRGASFLEYHTACVRTWHQLACSPSKSGSIG